MDTNSLLYTVKEACIALRCGRTHLYALVNRGDLELRKLGGATRITKASVHALAGVNDNGANARAVVQ